MAINVLQIQRLFFPHFVSRSLECVQNEIKTVSLIDLRHTSCMNQITAAASAAEANEYSLCLLALACISHVYTLWLSVLSLSQLLAFEYIYESQRMKTDTIEMRMVQLLSLNNSKFHYIYWDWTLYLLTLM